MPNAKRAVSAGLRVGERDEKGRVFLGWRLRMRAHAAPFGQLVTNHNTAKNWRDAAPDRYITRVYRPESKVRRALRELVEQIEQAQKWSDLTVVLTKAVAALKDQP